MDNVPAPGAARLDALTTAGFSTDEVNQYRDKTSGVMNAAGFNQDEINNYWGTKTPDMTGVQNVAANSSKTSGSLTPDNPDMRKELVGSYERGETKNADEFSQTALRAVLPVIASGFKNATHPIDMVQGMGDAYMNMNKAWVGSMLYPFVSPENQKNLVESGAVEPEGNQVATPGAPTGPEMAEAFQKGERTTVGRAMGGIYAPVSALAAPILNPAMQALPTAAEKAGATTSWAQTVPGFVSMAMDMLGLAGAAHIGGESAAAPKGTPWESAPKAQDFPDAAIAINGQHAEAEVSAVLRNIYAEQGVHPAQVIVDSKDNPTIAQDMAAGHTPDAYKQPAPAQAEITPVETKESPVAAVADQAKQLVGNPDEATPDRTVEQGLAKDKDTVQYQAEGSTKDELFGKAEELKKPYTAYVKEMTDGIKGANPYDEGVGGDTGVRVKKQEGRIDEKIEEKGGNAGAISDYLGGAIEVKSPAVMAQVIDRIKASGKKILEVEDMLSSDDKYKNDGYRAIHMQVELEPGFSAELQILPKSVAAIKEKLHPAYVKLRYEDESNPKLEEMREHLVTEYDKAFQKFSGAKQYPALPAEIKNPVLRFIKSHGGIEKGSRLDEEVKSMGNFSPRWYAKKGQGLRDVDNFPISEWRKEIDDGKEDETGNYVDRDYVLHGINEELAGNPLTRDMSRIIDEYGHDPDYAAHIAETDSQAEFERINGKIADYHESIMEKYEEARQERLALSGEQDEHIEPRTQEDIENELKQENAAEQLRASQAGNERSEGIAGGKRIGEASSEQRGSTAERADSQTEIADTGRSGGQLNAAHEGRRLSPTVGQKAPDEGLFDVSGRSQQDMFMKHPQRGAIDLTPRPKIERSDAENKILDKIEIGGKSDTEYWSWDSFYTAAVDKLDPIRRITDAMQAGDKSQVLTDTYKLMRNQAGNYGRAQQFIENGTYDFKTYETNGKSLQAILEPVKDDLNGLRAYAASRRAIELEAREIKSGMPIEEAKRVIADGAKRYEPIFKELNAYQDAVLKYLKDSGVLTDEQMKGMKGANKSYVPFYRVMDDESFGNSGGYKVKNPIKRIKGSERDIIDPIESIVRNTYSYVSIAEKNAALKSFYDLASKQEKPEEFFEKQQPLIRPTEVSDTEMSSFLKKEGIDGIPENTLKVFRAMRTPLAKDEIGFFDTGKWTVLKVDPDVAESFNGTPRQAHGLLFNMVAAPAKMLRYGLVTPEFILRHLERNTLSATVIGAKAEVPFENLYKGIFSYFKQDDSYQGWLKSGGKVSALSGLSRDDIQDQVQRITNENPAANFLNKAWNIVRTPFDIIHAVQQSLENINRLGAYKQALRGLSVDKANIIDAGYYSRNIAPDPSRIGTSTGLWNAVTALANTEIQHTAQLFDALRNRPIPTLTKGFAFITLPTLINWAYNHNSESWKETPAWERDAFWIIPAGGYTLRIPKPFFMGFMFATVPERIMDAVSGLDPKGKGMESMIKDMFEQASPNTIPTALTPILEQITNHSMFRGTPLVPDHLMQQLPEYRYSEYTSELTKAIGTLVGKVPYIGSTTSAAPIVIDNYLRAWTGSLGTYVKDGIDASLRKAGILPDPPLPASTLADIPFVKAFVVRYPSAQAQSIQDFQDSYRQMSMVTTTFKALIKQGEIGQAQQLMAKDPQAFDKLDKINKTLNEQNQLVRTLYKIPGIKPDEKRQVIDGIYYQMIQLSRAGNNIIDALGQQPTPTKH